ALAELPGVSSASFAFSEEGVPSLRDGLRALVEASDQPIVIVPMVLPSEPGFENWLRRTIQRWQAANTRPWPEIRIAGFPGAQAKMGDVLASCLATDAPIEAGKPAGD